MLKIGYYFLFFTIPVIFLCSASSLCFLIESLSREDAYISVPFHEYFSTLRNRGVYWCFCGIGSEPELLRSLAACCTFVMCMTVTRVQQCVQSCTDISTSCTLLPYIHLQASLSSDLLMLCVRYRLVLRTLPVLHQWLPVQSLLARPAVTMLLILEAVITLEDMIWIHHMPIMHRCMNSTMAARHR